MDDCVLSRTTELRAKSGGKGPWFPSSRKERARKDGASAKHF